ncbi:hypothetical protein F3I62_09375 [Pseudomonas sp. R-28-1W-6]|jgi:hypothetical protein|uniref:hypothetical protein n=1 Tax=Pseudomonas sp. R-28-1W-6 TaxID=2650101 RepID=UPI001365595F|nr:hypothetical protein [Pseudomonas sp. R-28-1W-6]MWV12303.1 hypothetical protein [Pseudomonas sp. R-28-1W-6]
MEIRIVAIESQPPVWRVYLNSSFIVCHSAAAARDTAHRALASCRPSWRQLLGRPRNRWGADRAPFVVL